ncbi:MAG: methionine synthase [Bacteroidales bacterium]|jgi:5-methyltetrahydrofolate--homocysteine methyltransferase|nr:methionine synthase [Bacteroidales bacterium]
MPNISEILQNRILVLDGAMGTQIQQYNLSESDFRGEIFKEHTVDLKGCNDILVLTRPEIISEIHKKYLDAGANIIETCSFNSNSISFADYDLCDYAYRISFDSAVLAKEAVEAYNLYNPDEPRFVAGSIGPTNKSLSISNNIDNPAERDISFDELVDAYFDQARGLIDGGVDVLLVETIFDTLNAKAALYAISELSNILNKPIPVMLSLTLNQSGRSLSGQKLDAFITSVSHYPIMSIGLNCSFGAKQMLPYLEEMNHICKERKFSSHTIYISAYPNAGMPNEMGEYDETPETMANFVQQLIDKQLVNIIGGCCGTSPAHIAEIAKKLRNHSTNVQKFIDMDTFLHDTHSTQLSGLELLTISKENNFVNIGEQTNVAGSRKFANLIREKKYQEAMSIARNQMENGAQMLDICFDDGLLNAKEEMSIFLNILATESDIAKIPLMIDSSNFEVIEAGLKCTQGKSLVNSINLKDGNEDFLNKAKKIRRLGAAAVVMLFDEEGQATSVAHKVKVAERAYKLLQSIDFPAEDIVFDPNILAIATGMPEHNAYALNFIEACKIIKEKMPAVKISGGVSNLSFSFRGNDQIRSMLHSVFLYHAINAGMDMGIVNTKNFIPYSQIPENQRIVIENVILNRNENAADELLKLAQELQVVPKNIAATNSIITEDIAHNNSTTTLSEQLQYAFVNGISDNIETLLTALMNEKNYHNREIEIIEQELMPILDIVGQNFADGKLFLPQIVKTAKVMKQAVDFLKPFIEHKDIDFRNETKQFKTKILLATVKGDVHDIGKNIASVVLSCNGFEIIDLGVMVPKEKILEEARQHNVDLIGLSGLITPSLKEMAEVATAMQEQGFEIPLVVGGASVSELYTAINFYPKYSGGVYYAKDASDGVKIIQNLTNQAKNGDFRHKMQEYYTKLKENYEQKAKNNALLSIEEARKNKPKINWDKVNIVKPKELGFHCWKKKSLRQVIPYIDWRFFFPVWEMKQQQLGKLSEDAKTLFQDAVMLAENLVKEGKIKASAVFGVYECYSENETIFVFDEYIDAHGKVRKREIPIEFERNRRKKEHINYCLADFIAPKSLGKSDYIGIFACSTGIGIEKIVKEYQNSGDYYSALLLQTIADSLADALTEYLHQKIRKNYWGFVPKENLTIQELHHNRYQGIRPAIGYPIIPNHTLKRQVFDILRVEESIGIELTDTFMMKPVSSTCGFIFANEMARLFEV